MRAALQRCAPGPRRPAGPIRAPVTAAAVAGGRALVVDVPLAGNGTDATSDTALLALRDQVLPETLGPGAAAISYAVTGDTAGNYDDIAALHSRTPLVLAVVAVLAFVLLLVAFRSLAIPLVSIGLNLLSVGAAYGLITLIFQDGRLQGLLGYTCYGGIVPWIPLFMFVFLFGLSMDYHVFILSRIRELRSARRQHPGRGGGRHLQQRRGGDQRGGDHGGRVLHPGHAVDHRSCKMLGVGLAAAVLIDATVVRGILLPAALALLGERSWYLPRWLGWLPGGGARPGAGVPAGPLAGPAWPGPEPIAMVTAKDGS